MDWQKLLGELQAAGWTQQQIAERVGSSQAAISDLRSGETKNPSYALGTALVNLHKIRARRLVMARTA